MEGPRIDLTRELILVVYKELRIQHGSDGAKIDVVKIGLQRQALKRAPPFAGRNDSTISPFIGRFWLQIPITAQMRGNVDAVVGLRGSDTPSAACTVTPRNKSLKVGA